MHRCRETKCRARDRGKAWSEDVGRYGNGNTALKNRSAGLPSAGTSVHQLDGHDAAAFHFHYLTLTRRKNEAGEPSSVTVTLALPSAVLASVSFFWVLLAKAIISGVKSRFNADARKT